MLINFEGSNSNNSYQEYEDSHDVPTGKKKISSVLALLLLIVGGTFLVQNTLAANISLNSGAAVEFGQGVAMTAACSGADALIVTPNSEFANASGSGAHYLKTITVSGIPAGCNGVDFNISVYDSTTSTALPMFGSTKSVATIWNNAGTFEGGTGYSGSSITSGSGTFTITFTTPVALASNVARITLQSSGHAPFNCALDLVCSVGDTSPSGGIIFYKSVSAFTETGTVCASDCHYLEYAPRNWMGTDVEGPYNFFHTVGNTYLTTLKPGTLSNLGSGYNNTAILIAAGDTQGAPSRAKAYAGPKGDTAGQWFVPSMNEINALYDSSAKSLTSFSSYNTTEYLTSVQATATTCRTINMENRSNNTQTCSGNNPMHLRPIRAF
jgi:hypothetical protein